MGIMKKNVTDEVREANRANSAASTGPVSEAGKKRSSMNAVKHGKYAKRPDPVKRLLEDLSAEEEAEREALRADVVERYQPPDAFAGQQAEELADLQFELRRLDGVKQVIWRRERELLELEQRRRSLRLKERVEAASKEINDRGLASQPDSPGKLREMLTKLELLAQPDLEIDAAWDLFEQVYGARGSWRGVRMKWALHRAEDAKSDEDRERARQDFEREAKRESELVREALAICEIEQGPLSEAGQAAWLLEVMNSRKWSWIRQQENFLTRSIDRKVRVLIDLKREAETAQRRAAAKSPEDDNPSDENPGDGNPPGAAGGNGQPAPAEVSEEVERADGSAGAEHGLEARGTWLGHLGHAANVETSGSSAEAEGTESVGSAALAEKTRQNQGTKPTSDLFSAMAWELIETELFEVHALKGGLRQIEMLEGNAIAFLSPDTTLLN